MGLDITFKNAANTIFNVFEDIQEEVRFKSRNNDNPTYTASSGIISDPYTVYVINMIIRDYMQRETDDRSIKKTRQLAMVPQSSLSVTPKMTDVIERLENNEYITWEITQIEQDPAKATWILRIERG